MKCPKCSETNLIRNGFSRRKTGFSQRYKCKKCGCAFIKDDGFKQYRYDPKIISAALDLLAKGLSLRDVVDHLDQHHSVKVCHQTISNWKTNFGRKLKSFSQSLTPFLGKIFHADEMFYKANGFWNYFWACIDYDTKFLVATHISDDRNLDEATEFLQKIKILKSEPPDEIHTDNSFDYPPAFRKVFPRKRNLHQHFPAWKKKFKNNPIERFYNTVKQRYKTFRCFDNLKTSKEFFDFYEVYYNFIRKHMTLNGKTPAQAANIKLNLSRNRLLSLIKLFQKIFRMQIHFLV